MGQSLLEIAEKLRTTDKKVQLIYAFNGTGKTRLSREFKQLISPKETAAADDDDNEAPLLKILYYNAYTEDLFFWDNDLEGDVERKLSIRPNNFTTFALDFLREQGQDGNIVANFQRYAGDDITPLLSPDFSEVTFSLARGNDENVNHVKVSKGEESNFIWCVFYSLLELVVETLNTAEPEDRDVRQFDDLEYVFIDDPVSSLDDTHLIELAVDIAKLIKSSQAPELKFIITTHNPLFYNVLHNAFNSDFKESGYQWRKHQEKRRLERLDDGTFSLIGQWNDAPFSYHIFLFGELEKSIKTQNLYKYHFNFLRNILEKTSTFLGYRRWEDLLPEDRVGSRKAYYERIINISSHSKFSGHEVTALTNSEKKLLEFLVKHLIEVYHFKSILDTE